MSNYTVELLHSVNGRWEGLATDTEQYWNLGRAEREAKKVSRKFPTFITRLTFNNTGRVVHYMHGRRVAKPSGL